MAEGFVGRAEQRQVLEDAIASAVRGRGRALVVTGEAGIGKTTLVDHVVRGFPEVAVAWGSARSSARAAPLRPWRDVLRAMATVAGQGSDEVVERWPALARTFGAETPVDGTPLDLHDAVIELLEDFARRRPLALVLDDVHWAGEDSLALLGSVAAVVHRLPVVVIATARDDGGVPLPGLPVEPVPLGGLDPHDVATLAGVPEAEAGALAARTGGNPLFVLEVRRLEAAGRSGEVPTSVRSVLAERLRAVPLGGREVLASAAVLGEDFDLDAAYMVAGTSDSAAIDAAVRTRLVVPEPSVVLRYRFAHSLVREAVLAELDPKERGRLEAGAAEVVASRGASASRLAHHLREAARADPSLAATAAAASEQAAREADRLLAWDEAVRERQAAAALAVAAGAGPPERLELALALADALQRSGRTDEARDGYLEAAAQARAIGATDALARAALGPSGGVGGFEVPIGDGAQLALLREAVAAVDDEVLRSHLVSRLSVALTFVASSEERLALADEALATATAAGDHLAMVSALAARSDALAAPEHLRERVEMAQRMLQHAETASSVEHVLLALRFLFAAQLELGDLTGARTTIEAFDREAGRLGQARHRWYVPLWRSTLAAADGELDRAASANDTARITGERGGSRNAWMLTTSQRVMQQVERGDLDLALAAVRAVTLEHPDIRGPETGLAWMEAMAGNVGPGRSHLDRLVAGDLASIPRDAEWLSMMVILTELAVLVDHRRALERLLELVEPFLDHHAVDGIGDAYLGVVAGTAASAAAALGDGARAQLLYERAIERQDAAGGRRYSAQWRLGLASVVSEDDPERARRLVDRARQLDPRAEASPRLARRPPPEAAVGDGAVTAVLTREGNLWAVATGGHVARFRGVRGFVMLAELLQRPGVDVPALELDGGADRSTGTGPAIDDTARAAYRARVAALERELDEADAANDLGRSERVQAEMDALLSELSRAFGLGGRARADGAAERARMRVTKALRAAVKGIAAEHPLLGAHLSGAIRTGTFCSYAPDPVAPVRWTIRT